MDLQAPEGSSTSSMTWICLRWTNMAPCSLTQSYANIWTIITGKAMTLHCSYDTSCKYQSTWVHSSLKEEYYVSTVFLGGSGGTVPGCNCLNDGHFQTFSPCIITEEDHSDNGVPAADRCNTLIIHMNSLSAENASPLVFRQIPASVSMGYNF